MQSRVLSYAIAGAAAFALCTPQAGHAGSYPSNACASAKLKAASSNCKAVLNAWAKYVGGGDTATRDAALAKAADKFTTAWDKAEAKALSKGTNCADMTATNAYMQNAITTGVGSIVTSVQTGGPAPKCASSILKAASGQCAALLKNEAGYVNKLSAGKGKRDSSNAKADTKFTTKVDDIVADGCTTTATSGSLGTTIDGFTGDVITNTILSPNLDDTQFTTISPGENDGVVYQGTELHPVCSHGDPYHYFVKRGTVNKLVMYYQGGGACWDTNTCITFGVFDQDVNPSGSDNPNNTTTGFGDLTNPNNPFKDWNIVFVAYCTGDIHFGDALPNYSGNTIRHKGWHNARIAEKFAREHFVAPDELFITGSSAGAYGAFFNAPLNIDVWPSATASVLADAGNGIITPSFLQNEFNQWNFQAHLPTNIPGIQESISDGTGIPAYTAAVTAFYPDARWAHYSSSYDGGTGGQTGFYNVMLNLHPPMLLEWLNWWHASCAWNDIMVQQAHDTAAAIPSNYRYYIGTGSRHTMYGSNKVYTDNTSGTLIVDWVNQMLNRSGSWSNVECPDPVTCGTTLPGDPLPTTRVCEGGSNDGGSCNNDSACPGGGVCGYENPFSISGPNVVISCP
jgi:hypothetical protein